MTYTTFKGLIKTAATRNEDDHQLTSSINALAALGTTAGVGLAGSGILTASPTAKTVGGGLLGAALGGATGYHVARMASNSKAVKLLAAALGTAAGGAAGYMFGDSIYQNNSPIRVSIQG